MPGKLGMKSQKPAAVPQRYEPGFLKRMDGRTVVARELKARLDELVADLGGPDNLSFQRRALCRRAIHLEARLEDLETKFARGEESGIGHYVIACNSLLGLFKTLGMDRHLKEITLDEFYQEVSRKKRTRLHDPSNP